VSESSAETRSQLVRINYALLLIGLLTRPTAVALAFTMLVAIVIVHLDNGLFMSNNGYEFGLALLAASVSLAISGGGRFSADQPLNKALQ